MKYCVLILTAITILGCSGGVNTKKSVTVSIDPLAWVATSLLGSDAEVEVLVPSGSSPETYEPTARQIEGLSRSTLYLSTGLLDFEAELASRLTSVAPNTQLVNLSDSIEVMAGSCSHIEHNGHNELCDHSEHNELCDHSNNGNNGNNSNNRDNSNNGDSHGVDPHIWLSPRAMNKMITQAAAAFIEQGIGQAENVERRRDSLLLVVEQIDKYITSKAAQRSERASFAIVHPSLSYYARDYGCHQIALEVDGKEPSTAAIRQIVDELRKEGISTIFYGIQTSDAVARVVAHEIGCTLTPFDPLPLDWSATMRTITDQIYGTR